MERLFNEEKLSLPDADIRYYPNFFGHTEATTLFERLREKIPWQEDEITVFGKTIPNRV